MPNKSDFVSHILERANVIARMNDQRLSLDWRHEFSLDDLSACCERMEKLLPGIVVSDKEAQRELIDTPAFAAYLAKVLALLPEDEPPEPQKPTPVYGGRSYSSPRPSSIPPSRRATLQLRLYSLLPVCRGNKRDITGYPEERVVDVLSMDKLDENKRLTLLESYAADELKQDRGTIVCSLQNCSNLPLELTQEQKDLLLNPCVASRHLFASVSFGDIWGLLETAPAC